jgi:hypothetical protein
MDSMDVVRGVYHMGTRVCAQQKQIELSTSRANWKKVEKVDQRGDRTLDRSIQNTTFTH